MKVLGLTVGRKSGNTETLVKAALMGAEEAGATVEFVRLMELHIKPCTGCNACVEDLLQGGSGKCGIKNDDLPFIDEKIMDCDGLVVGSAIYEKSPHGYLKVLNDRMGPSHDVAFRAVAKKIHEARGLGTGPDERAFKRRLATVIAVGGSDWTTLALPMLQVFTLPFQMRVVDQILVEWTALPGLVVLNDQTLERARTSGRHIATSLAKPEEEARYIGEPGMCPVCHSKVLEVNYKTSAVLCAVCGVKGKLTTEGETARFEVSAEEQRLSHVLLSGKFHHIDDLKNVSLRPRTDMDQIREKLEKYKGYLKSARPDRSS